MPAQNVQTQGLSFDKLRMNSPEAWGVLAVRRNNEG